MLLIKNKELTDLMEGCNNRDAELDILSGAAQATRTADANVNSDATIASCLTFQAIDQVLEHPLSSFSTLNSSWISSSFLQCQATGRVWPVNRELPIWRIFAGGKIPSSST